MVHPTPLSHCSSGPVLEQVNARSFWVKVIMESSWFCFYAPFHKTPEHWKSCHHFQRISPFQRETLQIELPCPALLPHQLTPTNLPFPPPSPQLNCKIFGADEAETRKNGQTGQTAPLEYFVWFLCIAAFLYYGFFFFANFCVFFYKYSKAASNDKGDK